LQGLRAVILVDALALQPRVARVFQALLGLRPLQIALVAQPLRALLFSQPLGAPRLFLILKLLFLVQALVLQAPGLALFVYALGLRALGSDLLCALRFYGALLTELLSLCGCVRSGNLLGLLTQRIGTRLVKPGLLHLHAADRL
jgi:hypothetical protein